MSVLTIKPKTESRRDLISLGEVLLRFDPIDERIRTARSFRVWEGGGEYNVARGLRTCFGLQTAIVTALADNELGRLVENLIRAGGVDSSQIIWREQARNGIYFIERGFGLRPPASCFDRADTAISQLRTGEINWSGIFGKDNGARWFHTGGIFTGLSESTPEVAAEAMRIAGENGAIVSFDLNYRDSLWRTRGGKAAANKINRELLPFVDVVFGVPDFKANLADFNEMVFREAAQKLKNDFPNLRVIASTLRNVKTACRHDLSAAAFINGDVYKAPDYIDVDVLDRVGSGDAFAAGFIYGLLNERDAQFVVNCGAAHAVLTMTTSGDNSQTTLNEVLNLIEGGDAAARR